MRRNVRRLSREVSEPPQVKPSAAADHGLLEGLLRPNALNGSPYGSGGGDGGSGDDDDDDDDDSQDGDDDDDDEHEHEHEEDEDDDDDDDAKNYAFKGGRKGKGKGRRGAVRQGDRRGCGGGGGGGSYDPRELQGAAHAAASLRMRPTAGRAKAARKATGLEGETMIVRSLTHK